VPEAARQAAAQAARGGGGGGGGNESDDESGDSAALLGPDLSFGPFPLAAGRVERRFFAAPAGASTL
jgi:hypothetical protein